MKIKIPSHKKTEITITICNNVKKADHFYTHSHKHGVSIQNVLKKNLETTTLDLLKALIVFNQCSFSFFLKFNWLLESYLNTFATVNPGLFGMICRNILQWSL